MARKRLIEFKGNLNGLYLNVDEHATYDQIFEFLKMFLEDKSAFYKGSKIFGLTGQTFTYKQKAEIEALLTDSFGIQVESLESNVEVKKNVKIEPGQQSDTVSETPIEKPTPVLENHARTENVEIPDTHYVFGTMRSGKSVHYKGHIVVIGDVNPGAEIIAEGNVFVFGRLLGFVHAGSAGNEKAIIVANVLKPTQIRIAKHISVPPSDDHSVHTLVPEIALVQDGIIKIEKYH